MTHANTEQLKYTPWFAKAGAACSIVPIARFVNERIFALKGGGYGCLFSLAGIDEEGLTDRELEAEMRSIEGALRGLPEGSCLYQYTRVMSGFDLPRKEHYANPVTQVFVDDRLALLERTAGFRRIDLYWCLTLEPPKAAAFARKPGEHTADTTRMLADLEKTATLFEGHLGGTLGLLLLEKNAVYQFFSYLFNLEEWAPKDNLSADDGVDWQIVKSPVEWHSDHLTIGRRYVQMFSLKTTPEASRPCLFSGLMTLDCDSVLCSTWRPKSTTAARSEIDAQEKFISFFKVGILTRVMSGRDTVSLETGAGARAANTQVDDLGEVIRSLDKKAQGEYSLRFLVAARSVDELRGIAPAVHRVTSHHWLFGAALQLFFGYPGERRDPLVETRGEENACKDRSRCIGVELERDRSIGHLFYCGLHRLVLLFDQISLRQLRISLKRAPRLWSKKRTHQVREVTARASVFEKNQKRHRQRRHDELHKNVERHPEDVRIAAYEVRK